MDIKYAGKQISDDFKPYLTKTFKDIQTQKEFKKT